MARDNRVIYLDYHYTWKDVFFNKHCPIAHVLGWKSRWRNVQTSHGCLEVYSTPPILPVNWINNQWLFKTLSNFNGWWIRRHIRKILRKINNNETTLINALNPVFGVLTNKAWKVKKKVYYCYDELKGTPWSNKWGPHYEQLYLKMVDSVVCTSSQLKKSKALFNDECHLVKNGVNLELFKNPGLDKTQNKIIGYVGAIDNRIDLGLLIYLANEFANYLFYFYGPIKIKLPDFLPLNILLHGAKAQSDLPELIKKMDICVIPFVRNELTAAIYPLKINEYLAMGKPVITTDFGDLSDFESIISITKDQPDFAASLRKELKSNSRLKIQKRVDFALKNSWMERKHELESILYES